MRTLINSLTSSVVFAAPREHGSRTQEQELENAMETAEENTDVSEDDENEENGEPMDISAEAGTIGEMKKAHLEFAHKTASSKTFGNVLNSAIEAKQQTAYDPVLVLWELYDVYGEDLKDFPVPGSEEGNLTDRYEDYIVDEKTGKSKKKKGSFYTDFFEGTDVGLALRHRLMQITEGLKKNGDLALITDPVIKDKVANADREWLQSEEGMITGRASSGRNLIVRATKLHYAIQRITETVKDAVIDWDTYTDKSNKTQLKRTQYPVVMWSDKHRQSGTERYTVTQIIALGSEKNIDALKATGATYPNLLNSTKREGNAGGAAKKMPKNIESITQFHDVALLLANFVDVEASDFEDHKIMVQRFLNSGKNREEKVELIGNMIEGLKEAFLPFRPAYAQIQAQKAKAGTPEPTPMPAHNPNGRKVAATA